MVLYESLLLMILVELIVSPQLYRIPGVIAGVVVASVDILLHSPLHLIPSILLPVLLLLLLLLPVLQLLMLEYGAVANFDSGYVWRILERRNGRLRRLTMACTSRDCV
jgi:membrane-anchored glycerophosphoryl diester phosphodiesterase (GDPDase)